MPLPASAKASAAQSCRIGFMCFGRLRPHRAVSDPPGMSAVDATSCRPMPTMRTRRPCRCRQSSAGARRGLAILFRMLKLTILTVNTHKGFGFFNRRFILHELRDAVRSVSADLVFLQEVLGLHEVHSRRHANWPDESHYEFLADEIWPQYRYGQNAVYPEGHHGNALLSKLPIA